MKKIVALIVAVMLVLSMSAFAQVETISEAGMKIDIPEDYFEKNLTISSIDEDGVVGIIVMYINYEALMPSMDAFKETMLGDDEEAMQKAQNEYMELYQLNSAPYYGLIALETARLDELRSKWGITDENATEIGSNTTHTYYRVNESDAGDLSEENLAKMEEARAAAEAIADSLEITEISEDSDKSGEDVVSNLQAFSTVDMEGNTVTEEIFAKADLTILNIWGTYCTPCIKEMPELGEWANELPENVQLIGLIVDVSSVSDKNYEKAEKILSKSGAAFTNLLYNDSLASLLTGITGTPTTLFIDKNGNSVREPIVGAYMDEYKAAVNEIVNK